MVDKLEMCGKPGLTALTRHMANHQRYTYNQLFNPENCSECSQVVDMLEMFDKPGLTAVTKYTANQIFDLEDCSD